MSTEEKNIMKNNVIKMFKHGYESYLLFAFPHDELKPLSGSYTDSLGELGNARRRDDSTYNGVALTLIDSLSSLAVFDNKTEFSRAVKWIIENINFDLDVRVNVFEANIRLLGGLLSAHLLAIDKELNLIDRNEYNDGLLILAKDLGDRLLQAFDHKSGVPSAWVNLRFGIEHMETLDQCTAGVGTLLLEFAMLSHLTGDNKYYENADRALMELWEMKSTLGLFGNTFDRQTKEWTNPNAGIGAGIDSFYEYLLKAYILLGNSKYLHMFNVTYEAVMKHLKRGVWYIETNMNTGAETHAQFNSLQAFWPGLQVMHGDIEEAINTHTAFAGLWERFGSLPERFLLRSNSLHSTEKYYPLRPEFVESTYFLYQSTRNPIYLQIGSQIYYSLENTTRVERGYASIRDVDNKALEDRMNSFFLAETCKYLYLLFDDNSFAHDSRYLFTTEGHLFPVSYEVHQRFGDGTPYQSMTYYKNERKETHDGVSGYATATCPAMKQAVERPLVVESLIDYWISHKTTSKDSPTQHTTTQNALDQEQCSNPDSGLTSGDYTIHVGTGSFHVAHRNGEILEIRNLGSEKVEFTNRDKIRIQAVTLSDDGIITNYKFKVPKPSASLEVEDEQEITPSISNGKSEVDDWPNSCFVLQTVEAAGSHFAPNPFSPNQFFSNSGHKSYYTIGELAIADPILACTPINPSILDSIKDKLVYVERGKCTFQEKMIHLQSAGAKGMILANVVDDNNIFLMGDDGSGRTVNIPAIMISKSVSTQLFSCLQALQAVTPSKTLIVEIWQNNIEAPPIPSADEIIKQQHDTDSYGHLRIHGNLKKLLIQTMGGWHVDIEESKNTYLLKII